MKIGKSLKTLFVFSLVVGLWSLSSNSVYAAKESEEVKEVIKEYFSETPHTLEMLEIARCESNFRQFTDAGNTFRGALGTVGIFQIHEVAHLGTVLTLGLNLETIEGNVAYAKYLYDLEGLSPWRFSSSCWEEVVKEKRAENILVSNYLGEEENILAVEVFEEEKTETVGNSKDDLFKIMNKLTIEETDSVQIVNLKMQVNLLLEVLSLMQELNILKLETLKIETA